MGWKLTNFQYELLRKFGNENYWVGFDSDNYHIHMLSYISISQMITKLKNDNYYNKFSKEQLEEELRLTEEHICGEFDTHRCLLNNYDDIELVIPKKFNKETRTFECLYYNIKKEKYEFMNQKLKYFFENRHKYSNDILKNRSAYEYIFENMSLDGVEFNIVEISAKELYELIDVTNHVGNYGTCVSLEKEDIFGSLVVLFNIISSDFNWKMDYYEEIYNVHELPNEFQFDTKEEYISALGNYYDKLDEITHNSYGYSFGSKLETIKIALQMNIDDAEQNQSSDLYEFMYGNVGVPF